jgi:hypothetical protein
MYLLYAMVQTTLPLLDTEEELITTRQVYVDYTNYRGERTVRLIQPLVDGAYWGSNEFHPTEQWLLRAIDVEKKALRTFAMRDVHGWDVNADGSCKCAWRPVSSPPPLTEDAYVGRSSVHVLGYCTDGTRRVVVLEQIDEDCAPVWYSTCSERWNLDGQVTQWTPLPPTPNVNTDGTPKEH